MQFTAENAHYREKRFSLRAKAAHNADGGAHNLRSGAGQNSTLKRSDHAGGERKFFAAQLETGPGCPLPPARGIDSAST